MIFNSHTLTPFLSPYIEAIFHYKEFYPDHSVERVVPTGHSYLIFELDDMPRNTFDNESLKSNGTFTKAWISGMHKHYISISAHQKSEMFVIQFKALGAYPFLHDHMHTLNEKVLPAEEILGEEILVLREEIYTRQTLKDKFLVAENWLKKRIDKQKTPPDTLHAVIEKLREQPVAHHRQILKSYPNTQKHLINQFKKYVGLTPKYFQRVLRFNEILQKVQQKEKIRWSQIAYQCGYADQSHFIKEFKYFSGYNPQDFILQDFPNGQNNFFPLDRRG